MINKVDDEGFTALHLAAQLRPHTKAMDIAKILLCVGADVSIINNHGETSAAVARRCSNESLAYYLETKTNDGNNYDEPDPNFRTSRYLDIGLGSSLVCLTLNG